MQLRTRHREPGPSDGVDTTVQAAQRRRAALDARYDVACAPSGGGPAEVAPLPLALAVEVGIPQALAPCVAPLALAAASSGVPMAL